MEWRIDGSRPIWQQLQEQLTLRIITGEYPMGSRLPSVRDLASEAGVNPNTMQRALGAMEGTGLLVTNRTAGRYVTEDTMLIEQLRAATAEKFAEEFLEKMRGIGYSPAQVAELLARQTKGEPNHE